MVTLQLYTYEEFLKGGSCDFIKEITSFLIPQNIIGKGAFGTIYKTGETLRVGNIIKSLVIKKVNLCNKRSSRNCLLVTKNSLIYEYVLSVDHNFYNITLVPEFVMEIAILIQIRKLYEENKVFALPYLNRYCLDWKKDGIMYIETQRLISMNNTYFESEAIIALNILQIMCSLHFLQYYIYFTHYDLHWGNIMLTEDYSGVKICFNPQFSMSFLNKFIPVINDFGTSIFGRVEGNSYFHYVNTTNNNFDPKAWTKYNEYFDGLTLLKSLELKSVDLKNIPNIIQCFIKDGNSLRQYYSDFENSYKPNIHLINKYESGLYKTIDIISNLVKKFSTTLEFQKFVRIEESTSLDLINCIGYKQPYIPLLHTGIELPDFPYTVEKKYYMDFDILNTGISNTEVKIDVIREVENRKIFAFSLFVGETYFKNAYNYIFDPTFQITLGYGKNGTDAFYRHYLLTQLNGCVSLIKNANINPNSPFSIVNQWKDFGVLLLIEDSVLNLPMFLKANENDLYYLWNKETNSPVIIDRNELRKNCLNSLNSGNTLLDFFKENNYGTVLDYIIYFLNSQLTIEERPRFGVYKYKLDKQFMKSIELPILKETMIDQELSLINSNGMIGSIIRFLTLQDPYFDVILFRDAHSTLPNRNYTYDREWYNTWINKTDKKFWTYHGVFYNPPHFAGLKSGFAAAWGCRKMVGEKSIIEPENYKKIFGFNNTDPEYFYQDTSYGVDERLLYRLIKDPEFTNITYLVGVVHFIYLIIGQEDPRKYKVLENYGVGEVENVEKGNLTQMKLNKFPMGNLKGARVVFDEGFEDMDLAEKIDNAGGKVGKSKLLNKKDTIALIYNENLPITPLHTTALDLKLKVFTKKQFELYFLQDRKWICREYDFVMPSYSFYTDLRCIILNFITFVAEYRNIPYQNITMREYFNVLDEVLRTPLFPNLSTEQKLSNYSLRLINAVPTRYHVWNFLFNMEYNDDIIISSYINNTAGNYINTSTICNINRYMWIGNDFNFDKYFFGNKNTTNSTPTQIVLPDDYPRST